MDSNSKNILSFDNNLTNSQSDEELTIKLKQQIETLVKENIKFKIFADFSSDWEYWVDEFGVIQYVSPSFELISGYSCQDLYNDSNFLLQITYYEDRELLLRSLFDKNNNENFKLFNFRLINAKNELIWVEHRNTSVIIDGVFRGFRVSNRDITIQIQAKKQFIESEKQIKNLKRGLWQSNILIDLNYLIIMFSNSAAEYTLIEQNKQLQQGNSIFEYIREKDRQSFINNFESAKKGKIIRVEKEFDLREDIKKIYEFVYIPITNDYGKVESISFTITDLSDLKKSEEELRLNKEFIQKITIASPNIIFVYDIEKRNIIFSNKAICEKLGYTVNDITNINNSKIFDLFCIEDLITFNENINKISLSITNVIYQSEYRLKKKDGNIVWFLAYQSVFERNLNQKPTQILFELTDVTDYKKLEQSLREINFELTNNKNTIEAKKIELEKINQRLEDSEKKLIELNKNKDKFFSIIAHDLRNPFNALFGSSSFLVQNYLNLNKKEIGEFLGNIYSSATVIYNLLENLLQWARVQSNKIEFMPDIIVLNEIINEVILLNVEQINHKNIKIINNINPTSSVFADRLMVSVIFRNLISNAIKFSYQSGSIEISAEYKNNYFQICISDTGVGIRAEDVKKLFKIESHYNTSGTEKESGTGLGLILSKEFIKKNNGEIWIKSEFSKGSKVFFTLPAY
ncbi:MAG: PAS domain-containing sensor histidine kinase [bacterium]